MSLFIMSDIVHILKYGSSEHIFCVQVYYSLSVTYKLELKN
jgi:hypothetical protein